MRVIDFSDGFESASAPSSIGLAASGVVVTPVGALVATNAQAAFQELDSDLTAHITDATDAHAASAITNTPSGNLAGTTVQSALNELQTDIDTRATSASVTSAISAHESDTTSVHGISDTSALVTLTGTQVITNKDYDGGTASNARRITVPKDTKANLDALTRKAGTIVYATDTAKVYYDNGSTLEEVGSGSGSGGINYIENTGAEEDVADWSTYADAAGVLPVDGTGGSPNVTWTRTTSSPLRGDGSFLLTKDAANRQGEGSSYVFSIDDADKAKIQSISFDYEIPSGTYVTGDLTCYIYDVTNSTLIQPAGYQIQNVGIESKHIATFQTASNSTSYRLIFHVASTSASAYTVKIDNVIVGPQVVQYGAPITDWITYTPTLSGSSSNPTKGTTTTDRAQWRRVGSDMEIMWEYVQTVAGADGSGDYFFSIPSGYTIDTTKINAAYAHPQGLCGDFNIKVAGGYYHGNALVKSNSTIYASYTRSGDASGTIATWSSASSGMGNNEHHFTFNVKVPITGWSSNVQMSNDTDTRVVGLYANRTSSLTVGNSTVDVVYNSATDTTRKEFDTHGAFNTSTGVYTVPVAGYYEIKCSMLMTVTTSSIINLEVTDSSNNTIARGAQDNAVAANRVLHFNKTIKFNAGQTLKIRATGNHADVAVYGDTTLGLSTLNITRVTGPSAIAASDTVALSAVRASSDQTINNSTIVYNSVNIDTHGMLNTSSGVVTIPSPGIYQVSGHIAISALDGITDANIQVYKTGVAQYQVYASALSDDLSMATQWSVLVRCLAGDTISIVGNGDASCTVVGSNGRTALQVLRVGN